MADTWLAAADDLLPFSAIDVVIATKKLPAWAIWTLRNSYVHTGFFLYLSMFVLLLVGREAFVWRMLLTWSCSLVLIALAAFFAPALGCFTYLSAGQVDHLPNGAGTYAMQAFLEFRNATKPMLALSALSGVITFPSFHAVGALMLSQAWHGMPIIGIATKILAVVVVISCVPIGGHYLIDLAAGAAVWWGVTLILDRLTRKQAAETPHTAILIATA